MRLKDARLDCVYVEYARYYTRTCNGDPAESLLLYTLQYLSSSSHLPISLYHTGGFKLGIKRAGLFATV